MLFSAYQLTSCNILKQIINLREHWRNRSSNYFLITLNRTNLLRYMNSLYCYVWNRYACWWRLYQARAKKYGSKFVNILWTTFGQNKSTVSTPWRYCAFHLSENNLRLSKQSHSSFRVLFLGDPANQDSEPFWSVYGIMLIVG